MKIEICLRPFYSHGDESRFFQALEEIAAIKSIKGIGRNLILDIDLRLLSSDSLWNLIALLFRYGIPLEPLRIFSSKKRFLWLGERKYFWYEKMFGRRIDKKDK